MKIWTRLSPPTKPSDQRVPVPLGAARHGALLPGGLGLHGFSTGEPPPGVGLRMRGIFGRRPFVWSVLVPTLLAAIYFFALAAPQYVSESRYLVRGRAQASASLLGEALNGAGFRAASDDAVAMK